MSYNLPCWYDIHLQCGVLWNDSNIVDYSLFLHLNFSSIKLNFYFLLYIYLYYLFFIRYTYFLLLYNLSCDLTISRSRIYFYPWLRKNEYYPSSSFLGYKKINFFPGFIQCVIDRIQYAVTHKSPRTFYKRFHRKSISSKRNTLERRTMTACIHR